MGMRREARQGDLQCSCWAAGIAVRGLEQAGTQGQRVCHEGHLVNRSHLEGYLWSGFT